MRALTERVLEFGHTRLGVISAETAGNDRARLRLIGIRDAVAAAGIAPEDLAVVETVYEIDAGAAAFEQLMSASPRPTAVLCGNDVLAAGALRQARLMGLDVPRDVSITGFDDIELARIVVPALTTVHVPHREMGASAARELVDMVEKGSPGKTLELEARICLRDSLGPPPR